MCRMKDKKDWKPSYMKSSKEDEDKIGEWKLGYMKAILDMQDHAHKLMDNLEIDADDEKDV